MAHEVSRQDGDSLEREGSRQCFGDLFEHVLSSSSHSSSVTWISALIISKPSLDFIPFLSKIGKPRVAVLDMPSIACHHREENSYVARFLNPTGTQIVIAAE